MPRHVSRLVIGVTRLGLDIGIYLLNIVHGAAPTRDAGLRCPYRYAGACMRRHAKPSFAASKWAPMEYSMKGR
jgi:hypothetical protein